MFRASNSLTEGHCSHQQQRRCLVLCGVSVWFWVGDVDKGWGKRMDMDRVEKRASREDKKFERRGNGSEKIRNRRGKRSRRMRNSRERSGLQRSRERRERRRRCRSEQSRW